MAILSGFPASNTISPTVRINEVDLSFVVPQQSFHSAGLVGFASKGPTNIPTLISSTRQLNTIFGYPHPDIGDPYLIYAAKQYLMVANQLYVVRVADEDRVSDEAAQVASTQVGVAGGVVNFVSGLYSPYTLKFDSFFTWKLNGIQSTKTLVVPARGSYTAQEIVDICNAGLTAADGIQFYVQTTSGHTYVGVETTFAYGPNASLELVSVQNSLYGPTDGTEPGTSAPLGLGTGMTQARMVSETGYAANYDMAGVWDFTAAALVNLNLEIVVDGSQNVNIDNVVQVVNMSSCDGRINTTAQIVAAINNAVMAGLVPGGFYAVGGSWNSLVLDNQAVNLSSHPGFASNAVSLATLHYGQDARILVKSDSTLATIFDFKAFDYGNNDYVNVTGTTAVGETTADNGDSVKGIGHGTTVSSVNSFQLVADSSGYEGNLTQVVITNDLRTNVFTLDVYSNGVAVESWGNLTKDPSSRYYVASYLPTVSYYLSVVDNTATLAPPLNGTYTLTGGSDGIPSDPEKQDQLLIGLNIGFTGLYALSEPEQVNIDLLAVPGHSSTSVVQAMLDVCQNYRQDCMAIIDPPFGLTVNEIISWQNGTHPLNSALLDSDFGALYWPWVKISDSYNAVDVWCPPSGSILAVYARSDTIAAPWFAPAGITRGVVPNITDVYNRPSLQERDQMYGSGNAINPIVQFSDLDGFVVWGQKTLQRLPTALDRVNVRRLMFAIEKQIRSATRVLLFEPNDALFATKFTGIVKNILNAVKVGRGLTDYIIVADSSLNTPDVIDRNEFRAQIGIQPTRAVEYIYITFSVNRTGDFTLPAINF